ncbi:MAG TPA: SDR family oxidoreductase [Afipia sp.]
MTMSQNKGTALVTGSSSGIGAIYADRLARRGYDLILVARDKSKLDALAAKLGKDTGRKVEVFAADLNTKADLRRVEDRLKTDTNITMLVNNAGIGSAAPLLTSDADQMDAMIQLNVVALTRLTLAAAPAFVARKNGIIINIASSVALDPDVLNGTYSGTKAYVVNFTQALHKEFKDSGVKVQAVLPGATATNFWDLAGVPVAHLPQGIVMQADEMVDAALAGLDLGELITIPSLPDVKEWESYDAARKSLGPKLSRSAPAGRYKIAAKASA